MEAGEVWCWPLGGHFLQLFVLQPFRTPLHLLVAPGGVPALNKTEDISHNRGVDGLFPGRSPTPCLPDEASYPGREQGGGLSQ